MFLTASKVLIIVYNLSDRAQIGQQAFVVIK